MSSFMKKLGLGGEEKSQTSTRQTSTSSVSAEHSGRQSSAAQKASNLVPATVTERDEAKEDTTVCVRESEVHLIYSERRRWFGCPFAKPLSLALLRSQPGTWSSATCSLAICSKNLVLAEVQGNLGSSKGGHDGGRTEGCRGPSQVL